MKLKHYLDEIKQYKGKGLTSFPMKYFFRWRKALRPGSSSVKDESPWMTFEAIDFISKHIQPDHRVFEFGGGGSTLFFLKRVKELATVEHDKEWFAILEKMVVSKKYSNWKSFFIAPAGGTVVTNPDPANPDHYTSSENQFAGFNFSAYAKAIDNFQDNYFDWVIVDGRTRTSCIKHAIPKIKPGGYLILDNSNRDYYLSQTKNLISGRFEIIVDNIGPSPYNGEFSKTTIWRKKNK